MIPMPGPRARTLYYEYSGSLSQLPVDGFQAHEPRLVGESGLPIPG